MSNRERMSSIDTAWLRMERPANLMMIVGVLVLGTRVDFARLRKAIEQRFAAIPRFRQIPALETAGGWWQTDPAFDIDRHVLRVRLPGRAGPAELKRFTAKLASTPLPRSKPLWEFHVVQDFDGHSAVIPRIHHCYADGIALMGVLLSLTDLTPTASRRPVKPHEPERRAAGIWQALGPFSNVLSSAGWLSESVIEKYFELLRHPEHVIDYAKLARRVAGDVFELATMQMDSATRYKGTPGVTKRVAWCDPLPLDEVKVVGRALGCSVNDVLLSCVSGALGSDLARRGQDPSGLEIRALVPVNLRRHADDGTLGNWFGLVPLLLPLGIVNPLARLREVHTRMEALKQSTLAPLSLGLLAFAGIVPALVQQELLDYLANKATAVMTNVPGPQHPLYLAGARVEQLMFWVPQSANIGMGVSILSYNSSVQFGLLTDAALTPDPDRIVERFAPELERLLLAVLMEPWDAQRDPLVVERELAAAARALRALTPTLSRSRGRGGLRLRRDTLARPPGTG
jgi:WS/DGAT/MGAT family acyltransferase